MILTCPYHDLSPDCNYEIDCESNSCDNHDLLVPHDDHGMGYDCKSVGLPILPHILLCDPSYHVAAQSQAPLAVA